MSDFARKQAAHVPTRHKPRGRSGLAHRLHHLADRIAG
jgi:hypothetical protein